MKEIGIGIIGVGGIAAGVHIPGIQRCEGVRVAAICDSDPERLEQIGDQLGLDEAHRFADYRDLIACEDVDAVEICTPNHLHVPVGLEVVRAGKALNVEKPLALNLAEAETLRAALKTAGREAMMCFSYRFKPAVRYAKSLIEQGALGEILGMNVAYLKDSALRPDRKLEWRFVKKYAGTGVLGDLGVHLIDMARLLAGDFKRVSGRMGVLVKERPLPDGSGTGTVETDDYCSFIAEMESGANAVFNITRCAAGHKNTIRFELYGSEGAISFNLNDPTVIDVSCPKVFPDKPEMHTESVPEAFCADQEATFVAFLRGERGELFPTVEDGVACQRVLEALQISAEEERWVEPAQL